MNLMTLSENPPGSLDTKERLNLHVSKEVISPPLISADVHKLIIATAKFIAFRQGNDAFGATLGCFKSSLIKSSEHQCLPTFCCAGDMVAKLGTRKLSQGLV
jgi:hypothetical protein